MSTSKPVKSGAPDVSRTNGAGPKAGSAEAPSGGGASPRAIMLAHLSADMGAAIAAGDLEAARVAHEAIGRLLGAGGMGAPVVDFASTASSARRVEVPQLRRRQARRLRSGRIRFVLAFGIIREHRAMLLAQTQGVHPAR